MMILLYIAVKSWLVRDGIVLKPSIESSYIEIYHIQVMNKPLN